MFLWITYIHVHMNLRLLIKIFSDIFCISTECKWQWLITIACKSVKYFEKNCNFTFTKNKILTGIKSLGHPRISISPIRILLEVKSQWEFWKCTIKISTVKVTLNRIKMKQAFDHIIYHIIIYQFSPVLNRLDTQELRFHRLEFYSRLNLNENSGNVLSKLAPLK